MIGDLGLQLHSLQGWLARHGLAVLRAGAPERALAMLLDRAFPIDLMIVDAIAPSAISLDLTADLARLRPGFPVLYIFGQQPSVLRSSLELQAPQCVLSAPFRETDLVTRIDVLLAQPAAGARLVSAA